MFVRESVDSGECDALEEPVEATKQEAEGHNDQRGSLGTRPDPKGIVERSNEVMNHVH